MSEFSTPPSYSPSGGYAQDKTLGIVAMVLSLCNIGLGVLAMAGGGLVAAAGAGAAGAAGATQNNPDAAAAAGAAGVGGMILGALGFILLAAGVIQFAAGFGIMKSARWGFILGAVIFGINVILSLFSLPKGIVGLVIGAYLLYYCISRLTGKMGPTPT